MNHCARWLYFFCFSLLVLVPVELLAQADPFTVPPGLEKQVEFWKRIFTQHSFTQLVFFDPQDMGTIYEVMEVGEDNRSNEFINGERSRIAATYGVSVERVYAQRGVREKTMAGLKRAGRHLNQMQQIFRERGLPVEISYLPMVESSFDINVRSYMGALGMWQFMPATGRNFSLRVDNAIDERRDPLESTRAAAAYLNQAYDMLGSWPLAITSYNYGPAGIARATAEMGSTNLVDLIRGYNNPYWGFAPKNFYAEFLAAVDIGKNLPRYFPELVLDAPVVLHEHELASRSSLDAVAAARGISKEHLLAWNPALTPQARFLPAGYRVKLPADASAEPIFEVAQYQEPQQPAARPSFRAKPPQAKVVRHQVMPGETLTTIALRYGASVQRILQANGLRQANFVRVGSTLVIPRA
jgi:membrane-bound lytic murein transglycosylase D